MKNNNSNNSNNCSSSNKWNRKILNFLWLMILMSVIVTTFNYQYLDEVITLKMFMLHRVFIPGAIMSVVVLYLEYHLKMQSKHFQYYMIVSVIFVINLLMIVHYRIIRSFLPVYTLPIFISVFSRESIKIRFAFALSLISFYIQNYFLGRFNFDIVSVITFTAILFSSYVLGVEIIKRYEEINEDLKIAITNEKELFYKTIYMEKLSKTDLATGLYNHKTFHEYLDKLLSHYEEERFELHLALFDLDKFKSVNDTYGHAVGDVVIANSAEIIKECIGSNDFAARYGGEEFAVIFTEKSANEVRVVLENIREKMESYKYKEMYYNNVTVSVGFVSAVECSEKDEIFKMADRRLYKAKVEGRNQVVYYD